jgi:hypothetical protein
MRLRADRLRRPLNANVRTQVQQAIAILIAAGQFHVAIETSKGFEVASFPNTGDGVERFSEYAAPIVKREATPYRFCMVSPDGDSYGEIGHELMANGRGPASLSPAAYRAYLAKNPHEQASAIAAAKACLDAFPFLRKLEF